MKNLLIPLFFLVILMSSCSSRVSTRIFNLGKRMSKFDPVIALNLEDTVPSGSIVIGKVEVKDNGLITGCDLKKVIIDAKKESRHIGGNVIKITKDKIHKVNDEVCHNIEADILLVKDSAFLKKHMIVDSSLIGKNYSLLHFYRPFNKGFLINYNIHDEKSVLVRSKDTWKTTIRYYGTGRITLWAWTENKTKCHIDIEPGKNYYIKCGIRTGIVVGVPTIKRVENELGKYEFDKIDDLFYEKKDYIYLKDGSVYQCKILEEDDEKIYIKTYQKHKKNKLYILKSKIQKIDKNI